MVFLVSLLDDPDAVLWLARAWRCPVVVLWPALWGPSVGPYCSVHSKSLKGLFPELFLSVALYSPCFIMQISVASPPPPALSPSSLRRLHSSGETLEESWSDSRSHLICFSSLRAHSPVLPVCQGLNTVSYILCSFPVIYDRKANRLAVTLSWKLPMGVL